MALLYAAVSSMIFLPAVYGDSVLITVASAPHLGLLGEAFGMTLSLSLAWAQDEDPTSTEATETTGMIFYALYDQDKLDEPLVTGNAPAYADGVLVTSLDIAVPTLEKGSKVYKCGVSSASSAAALVNAQADSDNSVSVHVIPAALSLLPPLITVFVAIATRNVIWALFSGVFWAAFLVYDYNLLQAFLRSLDTFVVNAVSDVDHVNIILFSWFLSGMVAVILRSGGGYGLAQGMGKYCTTAKSTGMAIFALGLLIFFDDYANTLIVGQAMRPLSDLMLLSREKLAFLVDATSAPVASLSPISSWIGFELSLISDALAQLKDSGDVSCYDESAFIIFIKTIPMRFYPFAMLSLQASLILVQREMGPMLFAERRARKGRVSGGGPAMMTTVNPQLEPEQGKPLLWWLGVAPIGSVIFFVLLALVLTGKAAARDAGETNLTAAVIFSYSNSFGALLWGSFLGSFTIWLLCWAVRTTADGAVTHCFRRGQSLLGLHESLRVWVVGVSNLTEAIVVLILAWSVGTAFQACGTGEFIASAVSDSIAPGAYPTIAFVLASLLALVTGTSWGTMAILFPLLLPSAHLAAPCDQNTFYGTIASILAGAIFGDHCSPVSDTTVLSAMSSMCDLAAHVKTQMPYALLAGIMSIVLGTLPSGYNAMPSGVCLLLTMAGTLGISFFLTAKVDGDEVDPTSHVLAYFSGKLAALRVKSELPGCSDKASTESGSTEDALAKDVENAGAASQSGKQLNEEVAIELPELRMLKDADAGWSSEAIDAAQLGVSLQNVEATPELGSSTPSASHGSYPID
eukprot:g73147.t1